MTIEVLLVEDHTVVRDGLKRILDNTNDIKVTGVAKDGIEGIKKTRQLDPDVILMDISMPNMNGIEATRAIKEENNEVQVVILSMNYSNEDIYRALRAGAIGYILKESVSEDVIQAVRAAAKGKRYLSNKVDEILIDNYIHKKQRQKEGPLESLSSREREILQLVVEGKSNKEIAAILFISNKTVGSYRSRMMKKLDIDNLADLVKFAIRHDIISLE